MPSGKSEQSDPIETEAPEFSTPIVDIQSTPGPSKPPPTAEGRHRKLMEKQINCHFMMLLLESFSEEQHNRYEMYRRSKFPKALIKRLIRQFTGQIVNEKVAIAIGGIAKVFVGQIVEAGLDYMEEIGDTGPLKPKHIREAVRRVRNYDRWMMD